MSSYCWVVRFCVCIYMFWMPIQIYRYFAKIFSQSMACLFIFQTVSSAEHVFLILMKSSLSIISFIDYAFGVVSKKPCPNPRSSRFFPELSSSIYIVLCFTFKSMTLFKLISVKGVRSVAKFTSFTWEYCPFIFAPLLATGPLLFILDDLGYYNTHTHAHTYTPPPPHQTSVFSGCEELSCLLEAAGETLQTLVIQSFTQHVLSTYYMFVVMLEAGYSWCLRNMPWSI